MSNEYTPYGKGNGTIKDVVCPCVFTLAQNDAVVTDYMALDNYNALKEYATIIPYPNCGHSPMVDCPDKLAEDVKVFFS